MNDGTITRAERLGTRPRSINAAWWLLDIVPSRHINGPSTHMAIWCWCGVVALLLLYSGPRRQLLLVGHHRLCVPRIPAVVYCAAVRSCTPPVSSYPLTNPRVLEIRSSCLAGCCRSIELPPPKSNSPRPAPPRGGAIVNLDRPGRGRRRDRSVAQRRCVTDLPNALPRVRR